MYRACSPVAAARLVTSVERRSQTRRFVLGDRRDPQALAEVGEGYQFLREQHDDAETDDSGQDDGQRENPQLVAASGHGAPRPRRNRAPRCEREEQKQAADSAQEEHQEEQPVERARRGNGRGKRSPRGPAARLSSASGPRPGGVRRARLRACAGAGDAACAGPLRAGVAVGELSGRPRRAGGLARDLTVEAPEEPAKRLDCRSLPCGQSTPLEPPDLHPDEAYDSLAKLGGGRGEQSEKPRASDARASSQLESLEKKLGRAVDLTLAVDASLLGGAIIQADDMVIDGSVRTRLQRLTEKIVG